AERGVVTVQSRFIATLCGTDFSREGSIADDTYASAVPTSRLKPVPRDYSPSSVFQPRRLVAHVRSCAIPPPHRRTDPRSSGLRVRGQPYRGTYRFRP